MKKRMLSLLLCGAMCAGLLSGCGNASSAEVLNAYNWGEYIDTDLIDRFEEETGIKVIYNTFDSNENLYSRIQTTSYDVIIPSVYAISRFINEDMLQPLNYDHIPNMCSTEAAMTNWEYIGYSSPQTEVYNELDEEITSDPLYFPDITQYPTEAYTNLPTEINQFYNDLWVDILT